MFADQSLSLNKNVSSTKMSEASTASMTSSPELLAIKNNMSDNVSVQSGAVPTSYRINITTQKMDEHEQNETSEENSSGNVQGKRGRKQNTQNSTGINGLF